MGPRYHQAKRPPEQWRQTVYYEERPTTEFSAQLGNPMPIPHASEDNGEFYITVPADQKVARGSQGCCTIKIARHWHGALDGEDTEAISNPIWTTKTMRQLARNTGLRRL